MIRVVIVDDSMIIRKLFEHELSKHADIEVVGSAPDPYVARDLIVKLRPDVLTLDIEMPRMDGLTFLKKIMKHLPLPVLVVSSITPKGGDIAVKALMAGAVDVLCKPGSNYKSDQMAAELADKIRMAAQVKRFAANFVERVEQRARKIQALNVNASDRILAIGSSTGGTQALHTILSVLPENIPGTVVCQHMPKAFTGSFASRLNNEVPMEVKEAENGDDIVPGRVLIAPGGDHLVVRRLGGRRFVEIHGGPPVNGHKPSVDVLFNSVAELGNGKTIGVILTGMGGDGAQGLLAMKKAGAKTFAQDEATSVVFGMPKVAIENGGVDEVLPLHNIPKRLRGVFTED